jgi:hypothetical protein
VGFASDLTIGFPIELKTGQLVKDELFTLFEAVGALEVRHRHTVTAKIYWREGIED